MIPGSKLNGIVNVIIFMFMTPTQPKLSTDITDAILVKDSGIFPQYDSGDTAEDIIAAHTHFDSANNVYVVERHPREEIQPGHATTTDRLTDLKSIAYNCDVILIGKPTKRVSALTSTHTFVFSDYEVSVESVLLDRASLLKSVPQIVIARPGGVVLVGNTSFRAIESDFPLFRLNEQYVFFLHFNAQSGSFTVNNAGAYLLDKGQVIPGQSHSRVLQSPQQQESFMHDLQDAIDSDKRRAQ